MKKIDLGQMMNRLANVGVIAGIIFLAVVATVSPTLARRPPAGLVDLDHVILAINDLQSGVQAFARLTGVTPQLGGEHPGAGTRNALVSLGDRHYLEILAPASQQVDSTSPGLQSSMQLTPFGWALHTDDLDRLIARLRTAGFAVSNPQAGSRVRPDGMVLKWRIATVTDRTLTGAPFFIEWAAHTPHPSVTSPGGCRLLGLRLIEPHPEQLLKLVHTLGVRIPIDHGDTPRMILSLVCGGSTVRFPQ